MGAAEQKQPAKGQGQRAMIAIIAVIIIIIVIIGLIYLNGKASTVVTTTKNVTQTNHTPGKPYTTNGTTNGTITNTTTPPPPSNATVTPPANHTNQTTTIINGGVFPEAMVFNPSNGYLYIESSGLPDNYNNVSSLLSIFNGTGYVTGILTQPALAQYGTFNHGLVYDEFNGNMFLVSNERTYIINGANLTWTYPLGFGTLLQNYGLIAPVAVDQADGDVYISDMLNGSLYIINGSNATANVTTVQLASPGVPYYDPSDKYVYVPEFGNIYAQNVSQGAAPGTVAVFDGTSQVATISAAANVSQFTYDPVNGDEYALSTTSGEVTIISGTSAVGSFTPSSVTYQGPNVTAEERMVFNPGDGKLYLAYNLPATPTSYVSGVDIISSPTSVRTFATPMQIENISNTSSSYVYLAAGNVTHSTLYLLQNGSAATTFSFGGSISGQLYNPSNKYLYTEVDYGTYSKLLATTGSTIADNDLITGSLGEMGVDPQNGYLYILQNQNITIINGTKVVASTSIE
jgi:hypothetical protein